MVLSTADSRFLVVCCTGYDQKGAFNVLVWGSRPVPARPGALENMPPSGSLQHNIPCPPCPLQLQKHSGVLSCTMQPASQSGEAYCSSCALWMQMHVGCVVGFVLLCPFLLRMSNVCRIVACRERERRVIDLNCPLSSSIVPPCVITYGVNIAFRVHLLQKSACRL